MAKITVIDYLIERLHEIGVDDIFGVPGDYNLSFLDDVEKSDQVNWVGDCNELNAAYAADGYARKKGVGALITTFDVGELSALNGVAGSYAEHIPVIAITGAPTTKVQENKMLMHHTDATGNFKRSYRAYKQFTEAQALLGFENAGREIDRVLTTAIIKSRPVYISLPLDVAHSKIDAPAEPLNLTVENTDHTERVAQRLADELKKAKKPVILAGNEIMTFRAREAFEKMINQLHLPVATVLLGKSSINEENPYFIGTYYPQFGDKRVLNYVNESDLVVIFGSKLIDVNTGSFTQCFTQDHTVVLNSDNTDFFGTKSRGVNINNLIADVTKKATPFDFDSTGLQNVEPDVKYEDNDDAELNLGQYMYAFKNFMQPNDTIYTETGTSQYGLSFMNLREGTDFQAQPLWGSIGYTLPAILGSQIADPEGRHILSIGDGSAQMTVQELSLIQRHHLKPIIFLVDNDGYTIERVIHGAHAQYNDIAAWDYTKIPAALGITPDVMDVNVATTKDELNAIMKEIADDRSKAHFVIVKTKPLDAPELVKKIGKSMSLIDKSHFYGEED